MGRLWYLERRGILGGGKDDGVGRLLYLRRRGISRRRQRRRHGAATSSQAVQDPGVAMVETTAGQRREVGGRQRGMRTDRGERRGAGYGSERVDRVSGGLIRLQRIYNF
jgi:hypothetical protein